MGRFPKAATPTVAEAKLVTHAASISQRQDEEQIRWAVTAYKGSAAILDQVPERLRPEVERRIAAEQARSREVLHERQKRLAAQLGPGEVARGPYVE
jgi:hypothetical protein